MSCVNINSSVFKEILKKEPNIFLAQLLYANTFDKDVLKEEVALEEMTDEDVVPEKKSMFSNSDNWAYTSSLNPPIINKSVLNTLVKNFDMSSLSSEDQFKLNQIIDIIGKQEALKDFYENDMVVRPSFVIQEKLRKLDSQANVFKVDLNNLVEYEDDSKPTFNEYLNSIGVIYTNEENKLCAEAGMTNATVGTEWKLVKDFKGLPKHSQGGVDIVISNSGVSIERNGSSIKAAQGLVINAHEMHLDNKFKSRITWPKI